MSTHSITVTVNGRSYVQDIPARRLLCDFLRDDLHLTGTKRGCETGVCGACTVLVNGYAVKSCLSLALAADGGEISTIEGLTKNEALHPVQESFMNCGGLQCGYCTPGFVMASVALLTHNPNPTEDEVRAALSGNLCRCTGYSQIVDSVLNAAENMRGH